MGEQLPKLGITDEQPLETALLRDQELFATADPTSEVPDVVLAPAPPDAQERRRPMATHVGIADLGGVAVGAFDLVQTGERSWVNGVKIEQDRRGERLAVGAYLGVIAGLHSVGRHLESDPMGLSPDSVRVWDSLVNRGAAQPVPGEQDQHGNQRYTSRPSDRAAQMVA